MSRSTTLPSNKSEKNQHEEIMGIVENTGGKIYTHKKIYVTVKRRKMGGSVRGGWNSRRKI